MSQHDFRQAIEYLEISHKLSPAHRGIIKSLGYSYTWLGEYEKALPLLEQIPEAKEELLTYIWWWQSQSQDDLAMKASNMFEDLE